MILHVGHLAGFGPHPDDLLPPPVGPSPTEAEADRRRAEYEALLDYIVERNTGSDIGELPPRISGWAMQLDHGDIAELILADHDGRLEGHLDGTRPIWGVPPVGTAVETAQYIQQRELFRAANQMDVAARHLQHNRQDRYAASPCNRFDVPGGLNDDDYVVPPPRVH